MHVKLAGVETEGRNMDSEELIVVSSGNGRLHVRFGPTVRTKDATRLFAEIGRRAQADGAAEILIDATVIQEKLSVFRRLQMITGFVAALRRYRVAGVLSEKTIDPSKIGETMARNRGANVRVFTKMSAALEWLGWESGR
ncbi:MAG TPA: hypothetical protein VG734_19310 [Lacunisphaera sp.]|nr:hypothetical protein [Lacunisphaera sp.]